MTARNWEFIGIFAALLCISGISFAAPSAPAGLMTDLLDDTQTVWQGGFPTALSLEEAQEGDQFAAVRSSIPTFSWQVNDSAVNAVQSAYEIELFSADAGWEKNVWTSGVVQKSDSVSVLYTGEPLAPDTVYSWRVRTCSGEGEWSAFSEMKKFRTAAELEPFATSRAPSVFDEEEPLSSEKINETTMFYDFGKASFARIVVTINAPNAGTAVLRLGERVRDGRVDQKPAGSTRYAEYKIDLKPGENQYEIKTRRDKRNSSGAAVLIPPYLGEVMPLRYAELELPADALAVRLVRYSAHYPFHDDASRFTCENESLNAVWNFCKYSIRATSFLGVYIDGDRERIPYEGDALLNQLSHYAVDRDYSMARATLDYLIFHPTWPTEWILQTVQMAWYDYLYTGDARLIAKYYDELKAKSFTVLADENGLISTRRGKLTQDVIDSVHFTNGKIEDIVDWPHNGLAGNENADSGETDGFVFEDFNAVVNAYYYFALHSMKKFAEILDKPEDAAFFDQQIQTVYNAYQMLFFDAERKIYKDGETTGHASLHTNMFALAFGLVPKEYQKNVADFIQSRKMSCSVYGAQFLLDAVYEGENPVYGFQRMTDDSLRGWLNMMRAGSTISMEAWDDRYKPNQDWNHAWGAAPANIIPRRLVGLTPLEPGCAKVSLVPRIEPLESVSARVPTIRGEIAVEIRRQPEKRYQLEVTLPANLTAQVRVPAEYGEKRLFIDGEPAQSVLPDAACDGVFWTIPALGSGVRKIEVY